MSNPDRIPVIIGVGQVADRPADPMDGLDSLGLMAAALRDAERDSGVKLLDRVEWLGVEDQISFPNPDIHHDLAKTLSPAPKTAVRTPDASGDGPMRLLNDAANLIASGEISVGAVVGGEAMRTANKRAQAAAAADPSGNKKDLLADASAAIALPHAKPYGLFTPADVYPLYEQATRAAWGQSIAEADAETGAIWAGNAAVAAANPHAWLRTGATVSEITDITADNRMISFPYRKLMVANNAVNQGAALIVASLSVARKLGIPEDRLVYVGRGVSAFEPDDYLRRDSFTGSTSMKLAFEKTLEFNGITVDDIDHVEFYSCFPCVPKMARRILGWPLEKPHSVYGGLTFGGAPVGNCMTHAGAAMVEKLRAGGPDEKGLVFANGGFATHNHVILLSRRPGEGADQPHDYNLHAEADAARAPIPEFLDHYEGPATLETYCMPYSRKGEPAYAAVVALTPEGKRFLAHVAPGDSETLAFLAGSEGEPVGSKGTAVKMDDGRQRWVR
jgi:acetyl-CoA C-acetyltransferase